jgi:beta-lactam-binding protein with PASTA domain
MPKKLYILLLFSLLFLNAFFLTALVSFQITKSGEVASVPDLAGMTMEAARAEMQEQKLVLVQSGIELHARYEKGQVIGQTPAPDTKLPLYSEVRVVVSAGKEKVTVPDFVGRSLQAIIPTLSQSGLRTGTVTHVHSPRYSAGRIFGQSPLPELEVPIQTQVNFLVSEGEEEQKFLMPDLLGQRIAVVSARLEDLGFRLGPVRRRYYRGYEAGVIIDQRPKQGAIIKKGNTIILEVTK